MKSTESHISEFKRGQFSPFPEEIEQLRKDAEEQGEDPDEAESQLRQSMRQATARTLEQGGEKARTKLEKALNKQK